MVLSDVSEHLLSRKHMGAFSKDLDRNPWSYCCFSGHLVLKHVRQHADGTQAVLTEHSQHQNTMKNTRETYLLVNIELMKDGVSSNVYT